MGQFKDAIDKQFPPKTDEQRAAYYAVRRHLDARTPAWMWIAAGACLLGSAALLWSTPSSASPVIAPLSAAVVASQRNSQECEQSKSVHCSNWTYSGGGTWESGPCKGRTYFECTPMPVRKDR